MSEPIKTKEPTKGSPGGRPEIAEEQYYLWLDELSTFLKQGCSLWYAIDKCGLAAHKDSIYKKDREDKRFSEKIDRYQSFITELNNSAIFKVVQGTHTRLIESEKYIPCNEEIRVMTLIAEKHRTSQTHWVNRVEEAEANDEDFGKVVDRIPVIEYVVPKEDEKKEETNNSETPDQAKSDTETTPSVETTNG